MSQRTGLAAAPPREITAEPGTRQPVKILWRTPGSALPHEGGGYLKAG